MKTVSVLAAIAAAGAALAVSAPAMAAAVPGGSFSFDLLGYNEAAGYGYYIAQGSSAFGTTQTFAGAGIDGQDITIRSSEVIGATSTTDTFVISTPTNFITDGSLNGLTIDGLEFDLANGNSGGDHVDLLSPITTVSATGSMLYGSSSFNLSAGATVDDAGLGYDAEEGVYTNSGGAISGLNVHQFSIAVTYANPALTTPAVPEPATWATMVGGFGLVGGALRRRVRTPAAA